jgi:drug/metabolite transporter (DMT)-like permease
MVGMDRIIALKVIAVICGLAGSLWLAFGKFQGLGVGGGDGGAIWLILATSMPFFLALGNIFRSRFWPEGAGAIPLAIGMLGFSGVELVIFALFYEDGHMLELVSNNSAMAVLILGILFNVIYYAFFFLLQKTAGPVYLGQIGSVSAVLGAIIGLYIFGEVLPDNFILSALLIAIGVALFQIVHQKTVKQQGR